MTKDEYAEYLRTPHWLATRQVALERAGHHCQLCNGDKALQVHHRTYARVGREDPADLTVLCRPCHEKFHNIKGAKKPKPPKPVTKKPVVKSAKRAQQTAARERILLVVEAAGRPLTVPEIAKMASVDRNRAAGLIGVLVGDRKLKRVGKLIAIPGSEGAIRLEVDRAMARPHKKRKKQAKAAVLSTTQKRRLAVRMVACPFCGAAPGRRCQNKQYIEHEGNHPARVEAAHSARNGNAALV